MILLRFIYSLHEFRAQLPMHRLSECSLLIKATCGKGWVEVCTESVIWEQVRLEPRDGMLATAVRDSILLTQA